MSLDYRTTQFERTDDQTTKMNIDGTVSPGGGPYVFRVQAPAGITWYGKCIELFVEDATGWASNEFADIASLSTGLIVRKRTLPSTDVWTWTLKHNRHLVQKMDLVVLQDWTDTITTAKFKMAAPEGTSFMVSDTDVLEFEVGDDLAGLGFMRAALIHGVKV